MNKRCWSSSNFFFSNKRENNKLESNSSGNNNSEKRNFSSKNKNKVQPKYKLHSEERKLEKKLNKLSILNNKTKSKKLVRNLKGTSMLTSEEIQMMNTKRKMKWLNTSKVQWRSSRLSEAKKPERKWKPLSKNNKRKSHQLSNKSKRIMTWTFLRIT